jgi:hypothetical protein
MVFASVPRSRTPGFFWRKTSVRAVCLGGLPLRGAPFGGVPFGGVFIVDCGAAGAEPRPRQMVQSIRIRCRTRKSSRTLESGHSGSGAAGKTAKVDLTSGHAVMASADCLGTAFPELRLEAQLERDFGEGVQLVQAFRACCPESAHQPLPELLGFRFFAATRGGEFGEFLSYMYLFGAEVFDEIVYYLLRFGRQFFFFHCNSPVVQSPVPRTVWSWRRCLEINLSDVLNLGKELSPVKISLWQCASWDYALVACSSAESSSSGKFGDQSITRSPGYCCLVASSSFSFEIGPCTL